MEEIKGEADIVFEASWEVCNKVGGINTVLISKAALMMEYYSKYFLIGPYFKEKFDAEVIECGPPSEIGDAFTELREHNIICHYGQWQIRGEPNVILVDFLGISKDKNAIKGILWEKFRIDSLFAQWEFEEPMLWSWAVGMLIKAIAKRMPNKKIVSHFHEWLAGFGLLYLKQTNTSIRTIFTTHATILGRSIAEQGRDLYGLLNTIQPENEARACNIMDKFTVERACAEHTDIFTTVSEITGLEAEKILNRTPEVLVLNGLSLDKFPTIEETSIRHVTNLATMKEFLTYHFFPYYTFNLDHTLIFFIFARYEFKNKGLDIFINALEQMNAKLKEEKSDRTICVFFWIPNKTFGIKKELLENKNVYRQIKHYVDLKATDILKTISEGMLARDENMKDKILTKEFIMDIKKELATFRRVGNPSILTHNIINEENDLLKNKLLQAGLDNKEDDRVKVILYPVYLDGNDGLLNLQYYDGISGCHLGVFPSYYEPWGYTPLEAAAMGVSSVTTDLTGFGRFIESKQIGMHPGIFILQRYQRSAEESTADLAKIFLEFSKLDHVQRVHNKISAKNLSDMADWKHLVKNYIIAHNMALAKGP
jgi:glycogen(starch) synthase